MFGSFALYIAGLLLIPHLAVSQTITKCPQPQSREDVINCALKFHPLVKMGHLKVESASKLEDRASQIPNPDLSVRYVKGDDNGKEISGLETNLGFTIELGGKRSARKQYARAQKSEALASSKATKADIKINTIILLYRVRQLLEEKRLMSEALTAFSKVIGQLKRLPRLSAEQEAYLILFKIAFEETKLNESVLYDEERELERFFRLATGYSLNDLKDILPKEFKKWPRAGSHSIDATSPQVEKLESQATLAQKELSLQKSDAWPNLKAGPSFSMEREGAFENKMFGFNIEIPIPLFQLNGGGKAYAKSELLRSQKNIALLKSEENLKRSERLMVYNNAVRTLDTTMKQSTIDKNHKRIEKLYLRGIVSSSLFLDSLRQKMSYLKSRNNKELTALEALWSIYKYDGKMFKEKL